MAYSNIIDKTFFYEDLIIPQLSSDAVIENLQMFIDNREPELLKILLGYELYKNYLAGIEANTQKYKDIRDGKEYTNRQGFLDKWKGLRFTNLTSKKSLIANYVYYWILRDQATTTTASGEKKTDNQNAFNGSPAVKMLRAWNQMTVWNCELVEFLLSKSDDYPEFYQWYYRGGVNEVLIPISHVL